MRLASVLVLLAGVTLLASGGCSEPVGEPLVVPLPTGTKLTFAERVSDEIDLGDGVAIVADVTARIVVEAHTVARDGNVAVTVSFGAQTPRLARNSACGRKTCSRQSSSS